MGRTVHVFKKMTLFKWFTGVAFLLAVFFVFSLFGCGSSLFRVETKRLIKFISDDAVLFMVSGYIACPVTVEGSFPPWSNEVTIFFADKESFINFQKQTFVYPTDFTTQFNVAKSGNITVNKADKTATLVLEYVDSYSFNKKVNGVYGLPIKSQ